MTWKGKDWGQLRNLSPGELGDYMGQGIPAATSDSDKTEVIRWAIDRQEARGGGRVVLPDGEEHPISAEIEIPTGVTLCGETPLTQVTSNVNGNAFRVYEGAGLESLYIRITTALSDGNAAVRLYADGVDRFGTVGITRLRDLYIRGSNATSGMGIEFHADTESESATANAAVQYVQVSSCYIRAFCSGVAFRNDEDSGQTYASYVNGNFFRDMVFASCNVCFECFEGGNSTNAAINGNVINGVQLQANSFCINFFKGGVYTERNMFSNVQLFDWDSDGGSNYQFVCANTSTTAGRGNWFRGYFSGDADAVIDEVASTDNYCNMNNNDYHT